MNLYDTLPDAAATVFGAEATGSSAYDVLTVDVPVGSWIPSLEIARDKLGCTYFDWLSAVDEPGTGFRICAHVVSLENHRVRRLLLRTTVPHSAPSLPSAIAVYAGAEWHERETFEMFGVTFTDHPHLVPLLLPENFEGHPLRKDFVLAARVAKAWPGAKEPGETHDPDAPKRRQMLPPGVPDPNDWGPLKGQLPPAPTRPTRAPRRDGATPPPRRTRAAATDPTAPATAPDPGAPAEAPSRPPRRTRSVTEGSASQAPAPEPAPGEAEPPARPPRRTRSASDGSASQAPAPEPPPGEAEPPARPPRRTRSASDGSASQATPPEPPPGEAEPPSRPPRRSRSAADGSASQAAAGAGPDAEGGPGQPGGADRRRAAPRSADAPWHHAKPAFEEPTAEPKAKPDTDTDTENGGDA
ncbi:NADH-quinone oxidoreductase subunit C [Streptomyces goshikiensis]|uniref:NADH-quinone oxidoreductase subunit C n=1 Tax=Streptomyces goshikiensis TaxID=1942 RepID=UPI0022F383A3|nr:NADH-quinone oxidoreductase subunit C [Streptomyces goshikiensis]WBY21546.1 NADH-quinone oxidoreductase subunit C [Streptomyces goshikiensis]